MFKPIDFTTMNKKEQPNNTNF